MVSTLICFSIKNETSANIVILYWTSWIYITFDYLKEQQEDIINLDM